MQFLNNAGKALFLPFRISEGVPGAYGYFGGGAPLGVKPTAGSTDMEHLFTLYWEPDLVALTCLVCTDFELVRRSRRQLLNLPQGCLQVTIHSNMEVGDSRNLPSRYPAKSLLFGLPSVEPAEIDLEKTWSHHKVGGTPFAMDAAARAELRKAREQGFSQLIQLCFPDGADAMLSGPWPFGEDTLFLLANDALTSFACLVGR